LFSDDVTEDGMTGLLFLFLFYCHPFIAELNQSIVVPVDDKHLLLLVLLLSFLLFAQSNNPLEDIMALYRERSVL